MDKKQNILDLPKIVKITRYKKFIIQENMQF